VAAAYRPRPDPCAVATPVRVGMAGRRIARGDMANAAAIGRSPAVRIWANFGARCVCMPIPRATEPDSPSFGPRPPERPERPAVPPHTGPNAPAAYPTPLYALELPGSALPLRSARTAAPPYRRLPRATTPALSGPALRWRQGSRERELSGAEPLVIHLFPPGCPLF